MRIHVPALVLPRRRHRRPPPLSVSSQRKTRLARNERANPAWTKTPNFSRPALKGQCFRPAGTLAPCRWPLWTSWWGFLYLGEMHPGWDLSLSHGAPCIHTRTRTLGVHLAACCFFLRTCRQKKNWNPGSTQGPAALPAVPRCRPCRRVTGVY